MIIVNQAKDMIVNFNNVESIDIAGDLDGTGKLPHEIYYETNSKREKLGTYSTEERAKEVLKEIVKEYSSYLKLDGGPAILQGQMDIQPNIFNIPKVYKMPEK